MPAIVTVTASIERLPAKVAMGLTVAVPCAVAVDVQPGTPVQVNVTPGAVVYPVPPLLTVTDTTCAVREADSVDVPAALLVPVTPPAVNTGVGAFV